MPVENYYYYGHSIKNPSLPLTPMEFIENEIVPLDKSQPVKLFMQLIAPKPDDLWEMLDLIKEHNIIKLDLSNNQLNDEHADILADIAKQISSLRHLILVNNDITHVGAGYLAEVMHARKPNFIVELASNELGPEGARHMVKAFTQTNATKLDLSDNKLGDEGALIVAQELQNNSGKINNLVLKHNDITDVGDKDLATHVPTSIAITHRVKSVPFYEKHPFWYVVLGIFFFPLFFILRSPCCNREVDLEGCKFEQKRRQNNS